MLAMDINMPQWYLQDWWRAIELSDPGAVISIRQRDAMGLLPDT